MNAAALFPVSTHIPKRFLVGDRVEVLRAARLPKVEEVVGVGVVEGVITDDAGLEHWLYKVTGFPMPRSANVLRLIERAGR